MKTSAESYKVKWRRTTKWGKKLKEMKNRSEKVRKIEDQALKVQHLNKSSKKSEPAKWRRIILEKKKN